MFWKAQLEQYDYDKKWKPAIALMKQVIARDPENVEAYVRFIYLLHNILLEEEYPKEDQYPMQEDLKQVFFESLLKFSNNAEYLFFIGRILHIAEWFFCINEGMRPAEETLAVHMQTKAHRLEPNNLLYELTYRYAQREFERAHTLAKIIVFEEINYIEWLKAKGFPGKYILEIGIEPVLKDYGINGSK